MVTSQSAKPARGGIALRTRLMRRSALMKVPSFSRNEAGQKHVRVARGFIQEQILNDHAFHRGQSARQCCVFGSD